MSAQQKADSHKHNAGSSSGVPPAATTFFLPLRFLDPKRELWSSTIYGGSPRRLRQPHLLTLVCGLPGAMAPATVPP
jgi:hypothetical protein